MRTVARVFASTASACKRQGVRDPAALQMLWSAADGRIAAGGL